MVNGVLGMAMVQDLQSVQYAGMPASAQTTGLINHVLPPADMTRDETIQLSVNDHEKAKRRQF